MNKKFNLILSCASLLVTAALLVLTVFSWYVVNQEVNVTGIVANTAGEDLDFTLSYYDESQSKWNPVTEKIEFKNVLPGTAKYFKLSCQNSGIDDIKITGFFDGITSNLDTTYVKVSGNYVTYNTVPAYEINSVSKAVLVDNKVLYRVNSSTITLGSFLIEQGYRVQYFGTTETKGTENPTTTYNDIDNLPTDGSMRYVRDDVFESLTITPSGINIYFALVYLNDNSLNKYYMYQSLYLDSLVIRKV